MFWREMRVSHDHLERYMPEQFFDGAPIHSSHYESTGKGAAVAMPGISLNFRFLQSGWKPSARSSQCIPRQGRWENAAVPTGAPSPRICFSGARAGGSCDARVLLAPSRYSDRPVVGRWTRDPLRATQVRD
jgi:hypothetical protein